MKILLLLALAQDPGARFRELNPGYRERAGRSYEQSLGPAAASLERAVGLPRFTADVAHGILKGVIYDFLEAYEAAGGELSRAEHGAVMARADAAMRKSLDDEAAFGRWAEWRESTDRVLNPLAFLTSRAIVLPGLPVTLPAEFTKIGWTLRAIEDDRQAAAYPSGLPQLPHQILVFQNRDGARLLLWVHRVGRAAELLAALDKNGDQNPHVFWRTRQFLIFASGAGDVPEDLKERLRRQLAASER